MAGKSSISIMLYNRLISYLHFMKQLPEGESDNISSKIIADALGMNDVQVRKDLAVASDGGKPKVGYVTKDLIADIEHYLGYDSCTNAVLVGVGDTGHNLLSNDRLEQYGFKITVAFDKSPQLAGRRVKGIQVLDSEKTADMCRRLNINVGIIAVPVSSAQDVCDQLVEGGIRAIWNFAPVNLKVPETVTVKNEDMAASLAILSKQLEENIAEFGTL